jgi:hypothetical protein
VVNTEFHRRYPGKIEKHSSIVINNAKESCDRNSVDLDKLLRILSQCEMGWNLSDNVLFSPRPSQLNFNELMRAISAARIPSRKAQVFPVHGDK